jgi:hypothetical protein
LTTIVLFTIVVNSEVWYQPDFATARRLAMVLGVPTPFLYAEDVMMAESILAFGEFPTRERRKVLVELQKRSERKSR